MNQEEKKVISTLPSEYRPLTAWAYFGYSLLFSIPLVGFICLIVFALSSTNINRRSYARSYFCGIILVVIIVVVIAVVGGGFAAITDFIKGIF